MITLIIPALLVYFFPTWGTAYTVLGIISLSLDWHAFYKPKWDADAETLQRLLDDTQLSGPQKEVLAQVVMDHYKHQLALVQVGSLAWWPTTSFRWLHSPESDYRSAVGAAFIGTTLAEVLTEPGRLHPQNLSKLIGAGITRRHFC